MLAYDQAHRYLDGGSSDASVLSNAGTVFSGALSDFIESQGDFVLVNMALWTNAEDWALSQWLAMTPEEQSARIELLEEDYAALEEQFAKHEEEEEQKDGKKEEGGYGSYGSKDAGEDEDEKEADEQAEEEED